MTAFLAALSGALAAITVAQNGDLALYLGNLPSTVVVHAVGLTTILAWIAIRREKIRRDRSTPWYGYMGGVLGVFTVLGCNASFARLGVAVSVALMLLGQTLLGAAIDQFGWLGADRRPFKPRHALSFLLIVGGIAVMMLG